MPSRMGLFQVRGPHERVVVRRVEIPLLETWDSAMRALEITLRSSIALFDHSTLHDKRDVFHGGDILQGISMHRDNIR